MKREQVFVRAQAQDDKGEWQWASVDVFDLDEESWRAFVLDLFNRQGVVMALRDSVVKGDPVAFRARPTYVEPASTLKNRKAKRARA